MRWRRLPLPALGKKPLKIFSGKHHLATWHRHPYLVISLAAGVAQNEILTT